MFLLIGICLMIAPELGGHQPQLQATRTLFAKRDPARWFITEDGKPTEKLAALLKIDGLYDPSDRLQEVVAKTQKSWLRVVQGQGGKELSDLQDSESQQKKKPAIEKIVREMGLFDARPPALQRYDYGICLGAFLGGVRMRMAQLVEAWQSGVRFDSLVFLTGERYLRKGEDQQDALSKLVDEKQSPLRFKEGWTFKAGTPYETEYDLCKVVWEQIEIPEDMRQALDGKVVFVYARRSEGQERPSTKDSYAVWLNEYNPKPGIILAMSHPLLWCSQQLAGQNCLNENYLLDTCASAVTKELYDAYEMKIVSIMQDTIAKCLFEISQRK